MFPDIIPLLYCELHFSNVSYRVFFLISVVKLTQTLFHLVNKKRGRTINKPIRTHTKTDRKREKFENQFMIGVWFAPD